MAGLRGRPGWGTGGGPAGLGGLQSSTCLVQDWGEQRRGRNGGGGTAQRTRARTMREGGDGGILTLSQEGVSCWGTVRHCHSQLGACPRCGQRAACLEEARGSASLNPGHLPLGPSRLDPRSCLVAESTPGGGAGVWGLGASGRQWPWRLCRGARGRWGGSWPASCSVVDEIKPTRGLSAVAKGGGPPHSPHQRQPHPREGLRAPTPGWRVRT